jgi:eukaryotic-like serine/threonine-protein kinase
MSNIPNLEEYRNIKYYASGGMARIYTGEYHKDDPELFGMLAIKVIKPESAQVEFVREAFDREAEILLGMTHPNIVRVFRQIESFNHGTATLALIMEFVVGPTLADFLEDRPEKNIPWEDPELPHLTGCNVKLIAEQLFDALEYAHNLNPAVLHLDIKTENIKLTAGLEGKQILKILDFGISRTKQASARVKNVSAGTVEYMPPEQLRGQVDERADYYATGFLLYELLTGQLPWEDHETANEILLRKEENRFPNPLELNPDLPLHVCDAIMKLLEADPELRPKNLDEIRTLFQMNGAITAKSTENKTAKPSQYNQLISKHKALRWLLPTCVIVGLISILMSM